MSSSAAASKIVYLGLDVHKDSVTVAVLTAAAAKPTRIDRYPNDFAQAAASARADRPRRRDPCVL